MSYALHQLIACEQDISQQAKAIMEETKNTFKKKEEHFDGLKKVYQPMDEAGEKLPAEMKEIVTTVSDKLDYAKKAVIKAINATLSKEETNASGKTLTDLAIGGYSFGKFSATSLIALERFLVAIRDEYKEIPTLDPTKTWTKKDTSGRMVYETEEEVKFRSEKKRIAFTLAPATEKFPANVQIIEDLVQVGTYKTVYRSGKLSPLEKSNLLEKLDILILEVKKTREKANQAEVVVVDVGDKIFNFIHS